MTTVIENKKIEQSDVIQKNKLLNSEIKEKEARELEQIFKNIKIPEEYKNKKLICRLWNEKGTRTIGKPKKIPYGMPFFSCKVGGKDRYFKVNYTTEGMIKNIDNKMYYDTAFDNSIGGFALRNYEFPEDMDSEEAYTIFKNNAVNMYVKKGGIPLIYLMVAMGLALVCMIAIIAVVPAGMHAQEQVKDLDNQITSLKQRNSVLQQQLNKLGGNNG